MPSFKTLAFVSIALVCTLFISLWTVSKRLSAPAHSVVGSAPSWLKSEKVDFQSASGANIRGWLAIHNNSVGSVVLLHPVRGNRGSMLGRARFLYDAGYSVLLIDLQAHGESGGSAITFGQLESFDAIAAVNFMRDYDSAKPRFVIGLSLGGAASILAEPMLDIDGLIVEAVYPDISLAFRNRLELRFGSFGRAMAPYVSIALRPFQEFGAKSLRPAEAARQIDIPVLVISGQDDRRTTSDDTKMLYNSFGGQKDLWLVPGARHQDIHSFLGSEYEERVLNFFGSVARDAT